MLITLQIFDGDGDEVKYHSISDTNESSVDISVNSGVISTTIISTITTPVTISNITPTITTHSDSIQSVDPDPSMTIVDTERADLEEMGCEPDNADVLLGDDNNKNIINIDNY